jgi:hypothetical protein
MFRVNKRNKGKIFPLYVLTDIPVEIGVWLDAKEGPKLENGKVKSKLGPLAFRPGWHLSDLPYATHIGIKGKSGKIEFMNDNFVWCACEYSDNINYQEEANENGLNKDGKIIEKNAYLKKVPKNGFYRYRTNPNMFRDWIIAGKIKVIKVLSDEEVNSILKENDINPMPRKNGPIDLKNFGF